MASITKIFSIYTAKKNKYIDYSDENTKNIVKTVLVESNNALMESLVSDRRTEFINDLNKLAKNLELKNTNFHNPTGLDREGGNISTARDLTAMAKLVYRNDPSIFDITKIVSFVLHEGDRERTVTSTNQLLSEIVPYPIIGGKTGETPLSKQNLLMLYKIPNTDKVIISVVLRSLDRIEDSLKLIKYTNDIYNCRK
jgi:D-alanyl-D-alanine carboxypeptidase